MSLGSQTVGFVTITKSGEPGYLGLKAKNRALTLVHGGLFQPSTVAEAPDAQTNVATEVWIYTGPAEAAALVAKSTGELVYDGTTNPADVDANRYQIQGPPQPEHDLAGAVDHVVITVKRQAG